VDSAAVAIEPVRLGQLEGEAVCVERCVDPPIAAKPFLLNQIPPTRADGSPIFIKIFAAAGFSCVTLSLLTPMA
jgi:hypothetical protein